VRSGTGGSAVGAGVRVPGVSRVVDVGPEAEVRDPTVAAVAASGAGGFNAVTAVLTPMTTTSTTTTVTVSRAGDRSGHCQTAR
jgi:hypothetical protein